MLSCHARRSKAAQNYTKSRDFDWLTPSGGMILVQCVYQMVVKFTYFLYKIILCISYLCSIWCKTYMMYIIVNGKSNFTS